MISVLLLVFGVAGICGNFLAGALVTTRLRQTVCGIGLLLTAAMAAVAIGSPDVRSAAAILVVWGLAYGAVPVTFQTWMLNAAPTATEAASSLYVSTFNLSIALGAFAGGLAVDAAGPVSVLWIGGALAVLVPPLVTVAGRRT